MSTEVDRDTLIYEQDQKFKQTREIDRWRRSAAASATSASSPSNNETQNNDISSGHHQATGNRKEESEALLSHSANAPSTQSHNPATTPPNRILRWALSQSSENFFSNSLAGALLFMGITVILIHLRFQTPSSIETVPWIVIVCPIFFSAFLCILGSIQVLIRECGKSTLAKRRIARTTVIDHINHICFWTASALTALLFSISMSRPATFPAMVIALPLFFAMLIQSSLWCAKFRHYACGWMIPDGFPIDPIQLTALFVAARVDQLIMWDWGVVLWCPWCLWILAVYNTLVYAIVTGDVLMVNNRESTFPIQEQTYAMQLGGNRYVNPRWLATRNGTRFAMALTTTICMWCVLHYGALRLNGDIETYPLYTVTVPLATVFLFSGVAMLFNACVVARRLITSEPHRCSYCSAPIAMMLQIDRNTYTTSSRNEGLLGLEDTRAGVIRYEDPADSLERDIDASDPNVASTGTITHHTHGIVAGTSSIEIPVELVRRAGQAMWNRRNKRQSSSSQPPPPQPQSQTSSQTSSFNETKSNEDKCTICRDRAPDCVYLNCGHMTTCWQCARRIMHAKNRHYQQGDSGDAI